MFSSTVSAGSSTSASPATRSAGHDGELAAGGLLEPGAGCRVQTPSGRSASTPSSLAGAHVQRGVAEEQLLPVSRPWKSRSGCRSGAQRQALREGDHVARRGVGAGASGSGRSAGAGDEAALRTSGLASSSSVRVASAAAGSERSQAGPVANSCAA